MKVWVWDKAVPGKFAVCCSNPDCAATGPLAYSEADAFRLWNLASRRTEVPAAAQRIIDELNPPEAERDLGPTDRRYV